MKYPKAPITEAILDVRVDRVAINELGILQDLGKQSGYGIVQQQYKFSGKLNIMPDGHVEQSHQKGTPTGFIFTNENEKNRRFQARQDGFTYNMLYPYTDWDDFFSRAFQLWRLYEETARPDNIVRIALRYINRILLPFPFKDFNDYFTVMPPIPPNLPDTLRKFFMQITVPVSTNRFVTLTETTEEIIEGEQLPFLLDLDVFEGGLISKADLAQKFNELRTIKNETFENCITDNTRKLFENV